MTTRTRPLKDADASFGEPPEYVPLDLRGLALAFAQHDRVKRQCVAPIPNPSWTPEELERWGSCQISDIP